MMGSVLSEEETPGNLLYLPREHTVRGLPSASQEESCPQELAMQAL